MGEPCGRPSEGSHRVRHNWNDLAAAVEADLICGLYSVLLLIHQGLLLPHPWDSPGKNSGVGCHFLLQCMKVKSESEVIQSCPTLSDPMDYSLPGSSVHGIFQARVLEWGVIAFSTTRPSHALFMQDTIFTFNKPTWIWTGWRRFLHHKQNINCTQSPMNCDCRSQV